MKKNKGRAAGAAAIVFFISMAVSVLIIRGLTVRYKENNIKNAGYVAAGEANKIKYAIDSRVLVTEILEMILVDNGGFIHDFEAVAHGLYENDASIRSIQLAPRGVVKYIYPLEGNEEGFVDLFSDPQRKVEAEYARDTGRTTLAGPLKLYQGGDGIVARRPIYIEEGEGKKKFWGFSIVVLNVPEIFDKADLSDLAGQNYAFKIWRENPDTGKPQIILENNEKSLVDPVESSIDVPNGTWFLSIAPKDGWIGRGYIETKAALAVIISGLIALACYGIMTINRQKQFLSILAHTDPLTGLHNARSLSSKLRELSQSGTPFGLLYLDLDKFKQVNDVYGHEAGDKYLTAVAERLKGCIGGADFAFRIGGDEFSIIITGNRPTEFYIQLKARIQEAVGSPLSIDGAVLKPRISCGYSRCPDDQTDIEELIKQADQSMYQEKRADRNL